MDHRCDCLVLPIKIKWCLLAFDQLKCWIEYCGTLYIIARIPCSGSFWPESKNGAYELRLLGWMDDCKGYNNWSGTILFSSSKFHTKNLKSKGKSLKNTEIFFLTVPSDWTESASVAQLALKSIAMIKIQFLSDLALVVKFREFSILPMEHRSSSPWSIHCSLNKS